MRAPNWLGDAVMALPALEALRNALPGEPLVAHARASVAEIWRLSGLCDEMIVIPSPHKDGWRATISAARSLRSRRFRAGLVFPNSFESALALRFTGAQERWGYRSDKRGALLTKAVPRPGKGEIPRHEVFYYLELLRRLKLIPALPLSAEPRLTLDMASRSRGREILAEAGLLGTVIAISPGAANSRAKQWPPSSFVETAVIAASGANASIAIFGTPQERALCEEIAARIQESGILVRNLAGSTTLSQFVCAIAGCQLLITNDSGGMHVASAAGVPTVAIFGPTIEEETGPLGPHTRVVRHPVECSPCMLKDCPIDHRCMTRVSPQRVAREASELVQLA